MASAVSGILGVGGGAAGTSFAAPSAAPIQNPVNQGQINGALGQSTDSFAQQQSLLGALQAQNGLANQSSVYNQLQGVANGTGPNPAQAQLAQATGQNVNNQAALMAGQRGSGANAGLIARQAAQQGAQTQQQSAGQAATMQANQSLNALGQLGGVANTQAGNQIGQTNAITQAAQANQSQLLGADGNFNSALVGSQGSVNAGNAGLAGSQMGAQQGLIGGALNSLAGSSAFSLAAGGRVGMAEGSQPSGGFGPQSMFGQFLAQGPSVSVAASTATPDIQSNLTINAPKKKADGEDEDEDEADPVSMTPGAANPAALQGAGGNAAADLGLAKGGSVKAMVSPGEKYLNPAEAKAAKSGKNPMSLGKTIPGEAKVKGSKNSYANDTVPATLEEGGLVLPRSVTQSKNPSWAAKKFVDAHMARGGMVPRLPKKVK